MSRLHPATTGRCLVPCFGILLILGAVVFAEYPALAHAINMAIGDRQAPGSSMGYFRDVYVFRGISALLLISLGILALAAKVGHRALHLALVGILILGTLLLVSSSLWYFRSIAAASGAVSP